MWHCRGFRRAIWVVTLVLVRAVMPVRGVVQVASGLWESVRHNGGHYAAFLISFFAIAAAWRDHHDIFKCVRRVDSRLRTLNTFRAWVIQPPVATGREGSVTQLDQEPT
jgi:uncharacterized membrane protein